MYTANTYGKRSGRFAAIVDLENLAISDGRRPQAARAEDLLGVVDKYVARMQVRVATGHKALDPYMGALVLRPWGVTLVDTTPEAADGALLAAARHFIDSGVTDLVVVSGDHAFVPLASEARLHVVSHAPKLSQRLRLAATTATHLPIPSLTARAA